MILVLVVYENELAGLGFHQDAITFVAERMKYALGKANHVIYTTVRLWEVAIGELCLTYM